MFGHPCVKRLRRILRLGIPGYNLDFAGLWINLEPGDVQASSHRSFKSAGYILLSETAGYAGPHGHSYITAPGIVLDINLAQ
jgi:hypothetical protein